MKKALLVFAVAFAMTMLSLVALTACREPVFHDITIAPTHAGFASFGVYNGSTRLSGVTRIEEGTELTIRWETQATHENHAVSIDGTALNGTLDDGVYSATHVVTRDVTFSTNATPITTQPVPAILIAGALTRTVYLDESVTLNATVSNLHEFGVEWTANPASRATMTPSASTHVGETSISSVVTFNEVGAVAVTVSVVGSNPALTSTVNFTVVEREAAPAPTIAITSSHTGNVRITANPTISTTVANTTDYSVEFVSSNNEYATVTEIGAVTFLRTGAVTITANLRINGEIEDSDSVSFQIFNVPTGIQIIGTNHYAREDFEISLDELAEMIFVAPLFPSYELVFTAPATANNVARVRDCCEVVYFTSHGTGTIVVSIPNTEFTQTITITVSAEPTSVEIIWDGSTSVNVDYAGVIQLNARLNPGVGSVGIRWHSSDEAVATITNGLVDIISDGTVTFSVFIFDVVGTYIDEDSITFTFLPAGTYGITFNLDGGVWPYGTDYPVSGQIDTTIQLPTEVPTKGGFTFNHWQVQGTATIYVAGALTTTTITQSGITFVAIWSARTDIEVTFNPNGGEGLSEISRQVTFGAEYGTLPSVSKNGYTFLGWWTALVDGEEILATTAVANYSPHTLFARWSLDTFTLAFLNLSGATHSNPLTFTVHTAGFDLSAPTLRNGYRFDGWFTEANGAGTSIASISALENHVLYAHWIAYNISLDFAPNTSVSANNANIDLGAQILVDGSSPVGNLPFSVIWSTSNENIATVNQYGVVSFVSTSLGGVVTITATIAGTTRSASANFTVGAVATGIEVTGLRSAIYEIDTTVQLTAVVVPHPHATGYSLTFKTDCDGDVIEIDQNGLVSIIAPGTSTITISIDGTSIYVELVFTVNSAPVHPTNVSIVDPTINLRQGDVYQFRYIVEPLYANYTILWTVSDEMSFITSDHISSIATINPLTGLATFTGYGEVFVFVTLAEIDNPFHITSHMLTLDVSPFPSEITIDGESERTVLTSSSNVTLSVNLGPDTIDTTRATNIIWQSSDTSVATVSANGVVSFVGAGATIISATIEGTTVSDYVTFTVVVPAFITFLGGERGGENVTLEFMPGEVNFNMANIAGNAYFVLLGWFAVGDDTILIEPNYAMSETIQSGSELVFVAQWRTFFRVNYANSRPDSTTAAWAVGGANQNQLREVGTSFNLVNPTDAQDAVMEQRFGGWAWTGLEISFAGGASLPWALHGTTVGQTLNLYTRWFESTIIRDELTVEWTENASELNTTASIAYDFISYSTDLVETRIHPVGNATSFTISSTGGFVTNIRIVANLQDGISRGAVVQNELPTFDGFYDVATLLLSDLDLNEAFVQLAENNAVGANRNELISLLVNTAVANLETQRYVNVNQVGRSAVTALVVNMNLSVGGNAVVNRDENGNVINSYIRTVAFATGTGIGSGVAVERASRGDRVFFNAETEMLNKQSVMSQAAQNQMVTNANLQVRWGHGQRNTRREMTLAQWYDYYTLSPYGLFNYIVSSQTISNSTYQTFSNFNGNQGAAGDVTSRRVNQTINRQAITLDSNDNFVFSIVLNARLAGERNIHGIVRAGELSGGATYRDGDWLTLEFVVCSETLLIREYTTNSRYDAHDVIDADTRVRTTMTFTYADENRPLPWHGEHDATNEKTNTSNPVSCVVTGTLITMADGTQRVVEDVRVGDLIKVWNFYTGNFDIAPVIIIDKGEEDLKEVLQLNFSDGSYVNIFHAHGFWSKTANEYVRITAENVHEFVGHAFARHNENMTAMTSAVLTSFELIEKRVETFNLITPVHLSYIANGFLTTPGAFIRAGIMNTLRVSQETMMFDMEYRNAMIAQFGLFTFEVFQAIAPDAPRDLFYALNGQYFGIMLGKGLTTIDIVLDFISEFLALAE